MTWIIISLCFLCTTLTAKGQNTLNADSLAHALPAAKTDTQRALILVSLSMAYKGIDVPKEFYYADEALGLSEKMGWRKGRMYAEELIAECYNKVMAYSDALIHFKISLGEARRLNEINVQAICLTFMVQACYDLNKLDDMVVYQRELLELSERVGEPVNICNQMNTYALRLSDDYQYRNAISYWQKNIAFAKAHFAGQQKNELLANILNTFANTYVKIHKPDSALYCLRTAVALTTDFSLKAYIISTFCDVYESTQTDDSAELYGEQTVKMGTILNNIDLQRHYCETLSRVYEEDDKPTQALIYYKKTDSLTNAINNTRKTIDQAMQFTRIHIDQQAERNKLEKRSYEVIRRNQKAALTSVIIALIAVITLTTFIYRSLRQKQRANTIISLQAGSLQEQNKIIDEALKEKEMLLKETHHRVKNNLQLISSLLELQTRTIEDENAKNALRAAQRRVLSIATVHSRLYGSDEDGEIEFSSFATDLFTRLNNAFGGDGRVVGFNNTIPVIPLPLGKVVILGLIINELITNSFKHAFLHTHQAVIQISLEDDDNVYRLRYYDNGPGLADNVSFNTTGSLGLYLIRRLSKQLKGIAEYSYNAGSTFTIIFPHAGS